MRFLAKQGRHSLSFSLSLSLCVCILDPRPQCLSSRVRTVSTSPPSPTVFHTFRLEAPKNTWNAMTGTLPQESRARAVETVGQKSVRLAVRGEPGGGGANNCMGSFTNRQVSTKRPSRYATISFSATPWRSLTGGPYRHSVSIRSTHGTFTSDEAGWLCGKRVLLQARRSFRALTTCLFE